MRKQESYNKFKRKCTRQCNALRKRRPTPLSTFKPKGTIPARRTQHPHHYLENTPRTNGDTHHNNGRKKYICKTLVVLPDMAHKMTHHSNNHRRTKTMAIKCNRNIDCMNKSHNASRNIKPNKFKNAANISMTRYTTSRNQFGIHCLIQQSLSRRNWDVLPEYRRLNAGMPHAHHTLWRSNTHQWHETQEQRPNATSWIHCWQGALFHASQVPSTQRQRPQSKHWNPTAKLRMDTARSTW
jgi:hypothetical protein